VDAAGNNFTNICDGLDRPKLMGGPATIAGVSTQHVTRFYYDGLGLGSTNEDNLGRRHITRFDEAQRPVSIEIRDAFNNNALLWKQTTSYASNHNSFTSITGTGVGAIKHVAFTDTFGKTVLEQSFPTTLDFDFSRAIYDPAGNLVESRDELGQSTTLTYDGLSRLSSSRSADGAQTKYGYNAASSLTSRIMPGGMTWSAKYSASGQRIYEQLASGSQTNRQFTNVFFTAGPFAGLPQKVIDLGRSITNSFSYDSLLRLVTNYTAGALTEHTLVTAFQFDRQNRATNYIQSSGLNPETRVARRYDAYGQTINEQVYLGGVLQSAFDQKWNAAGQRTMLKTSGAQFDYGHRVDDRLASVTAFGFTCNFGYGDNGLLTSRNPAPCIS